MTRQTAHDPADRCRWKLQLLRPLYQRGVPREVVRDLFRMIDWMMDLPTVISKRGLTLWEDSDFTLKQAVRRGSDPFLKLNGRNKCLTSLRLNDMG